MTPALALLEFDTVATGILVVDAMLKKSPVALLRCGSVHPGRYLALVGGSVASTEEAHAEGRRVASQRGGLVDSVFLADPHPDLAAAVAGERVEGEGEAVGVCDVSNSPAVLRAVDAVLKSVPVRLLELRLADDLGGHALALFDGQLHDVQDALDTMAARVAPATLVASSLLPRVDETLRMVLGAGTGFAACAARTPEGAEILAGEE